MRRDAQQHDECAYAARMLGSAGGMRRVRRGGSGRAQCGWEGSDRPDSKGGSARHGRWRGAARARRRAAHVPKEARSKDHRQVFCAHFVQLQECRTRLAEP